MVMELLRNIGTTIGQYLTTYRPLADSLDILAVALMIFFVIRLIRDSRAEQLIKGIIVLVVIFILAYIFKLETVKFLLKAVLDNGLLVVVVIFQPELRRALEQAGHSRKGMSRLLLGLSPADATADMEQWSLAIEATANAVDILQKQKMGALIVMERSTRLGEIVRSGTIIEAEPSGQLISNIFFNKAPLHDGAMIIRDGKIHAAGCILPLSDNLQLSAELGTRHRAGVGMSEDSDSVVVILSEENGIVSIAQGGKLTRNYTHETLVKSLEDRLLWGDQEEKRSSFFRFKKTKAPQKKDESEK